MKVKLIAIIAMLVQISSSEAAPSSLGPLSEFITPGNDGTWQVQDDGNAAYLSNENSNGAVIYYYTNPKPQSEGKRSISVDVALGNSTQQSLAGLLYGYQDNPKSYFAYTVGGDRTISIHQMQNGEFTEIDRVPVDSLTAEKTTLKIVENGTKITLSANGQELNSYTDNQLGKGATGIIAGNIGQFKFSNFSIKNTDDPITTSTFGQASLLPAEINQPTEVQSNPATSLDTKTTVTTVTSTTIEPTKYFPETDASVNGMISSYTPFPASWKQLQGNNEFLFEGPNHIKVSGTFGRLFQYSTNHDGLQMLQQSGQKNTPPMPIERIVQEFFMPTAKETKRTLLKTYPLPEYAQTTASFRASLFKSVPTQESTDAYALEWVDEDGLSYLTALVIANSQAFPISSWFMQGQYIVAKTENFKSASDAFLYGITYKEINPKWLQAINQRDAQRAGQSWSEHRSRMDSIKARGRASQSVAKIYSEISDISHAGYLERSAIQSHGHSASIRANNEQSLIANHSTGEHYVVDGLQNHHWVNNNGVHIATDNSLFDPRKDETLKMFNWTQFQKE